MPNVLMPKLADSMEEGTILRWLVEPGAEVSVGDNLVEIETDKATMVHAAELAGPLTIHAAEGDTCPVGAPIAAIGPADPVAAVPAPPAARAGQAASPVARRLARAHGVDLARLAGSGPGGRIVKADVVAAATTTNGAGTAEPRPAVRADDARGAAALEALSRRQQIVAQRMAHSHATVPDYALTADVDMEAAVALRAEIRAASGDGAPVPTLNDMVIKACALALRALPRANGAYTEDGLETYARVNVGIAVAADDTLIVPTVFDADRLTLRAIAQTTRALAERVRNGTVTAGDLEGGTFTVSNLGMFGVRAFSAIVNQPQAAILAVGCVEPRPVVHEGAIAARSTMTLTLCCDHRILNGADGARILSHVREALERPISMLS